MATIFECLPEINKTVLTPLDAGDQILVVTGDIDQQNYQLLNVVKRVTQKGVLGFIKLYFEDAITGKQLDPIDLKNGVPSSWIYVRKVLANGRGAKAAKRAVELASFLNAATADSESNETVTEQNVNATNDNP